MSIDPGDHREWYYDKFQHGQVGPVSANIIRRLLEEKMIYPKTLVWTGSFGANWKPLSETEFYTWATFGVPPPLPPEPLSNVLAWLLAFVPVVWVFALGHEVVGWAISAVLSVTLFLNDRKNIERSGLEPPVPASVALAFAVLGGLIGMLYLYRRAQATKDTYAIFWTSVGVYVGTFGIGMLEMFLVASRGG